MDYRKSSITVPDTKIHLNVMFECNFIDTLLSTCECVSFLLEAMFLYRQGRHDEAQVDIEKALALESSDISVVSQAAEIFR